MANQNTSCRLSGFIRKHGSDFMKTLFILSNASGYGGAEKSIELLLPILSEKFKVVVFVENEQHFYSLRQLSQYSKVKKMVQGKRPWSIVQNLYLLYSFIRTENPDVILSNTNKGAFFLTILSFINRAGCSKRFVYLRDFQWKYFKFICWRLSQSTFIVPSEAILEKRDYLNALDKKRIQIIGDPVNMDIRSTFIEDHSAYILCLANISKWKGIEYLIKAFTKSKAPLKGIKLFLFGKVIDRRYFRFLQQLAEYKEKSNHIIFHDFTNDVDSIYANSLFVMNTSIDEFGGPETFGRTIIEGWKHKKAVIAFACGGPKYLIDHGINGYLVENKNIEQLAQKMNILIEDASLRKQFGMNGYKKVEKKYSTEIIASQLIAEFE